MTTKGSDSAFPETSLNRNGLTKREYFTIMILQGMYAGNYGMPNERVNEAVMVVDRLIYTLNGG